MNEAVTVAGLAGIISLATLLIASAAGGILLFVIEKRTVRVDH